MSNNDDFRMARPANRGFQEAMNAPFDYNETGKDLGESRKRLGDAGKFQIQQSIERRGGIRFNYAPTKESAQTRVRWIPFYENPLITESRKANYASTKIFLRNEPVRLYTGSEARKFKVEIHYSLIHMASMMSTQDMFDLFAGENATFEELQMVKDYLLDVMERDTDSSRSYITPQQAGENFNERANVKDGPFGGVAGPKIGESRDPQRQNWNDAFLWVLRTEGRWLDYHKIINYIVNNLRNSVMSTAQTPVKGPPIVELKWGALYDFVPCIITDYRFQPVEAAGYDSKSLTAQRLKVSLSLEEFRNINGNLWGDPEVGGNLPGWDTVLNLGGMDPLSERRQQTIDNTAAVNERISALDTDLPPNLGGPGSLA